MVRAQHYKGHGIGHRFNFGKGHRFNFWVHVLLFSFF